MTTSDLKISQRPALGTAEATDKIPAVRSVDGVLTTGFLTAEDFAVLAEGPQGVQGPAGRSNDSAYTGPLVFPPGFSAPTAASTVVTDTDVTISASSGRYYRSNTLANMAFPGGVTDGTEVRASFTLKSGTVPATKTWALTGGSGQSGNFALNSATGDYEATFTPNSGNTTLNIDFQASADCVISRPVYGFLNPSNDPVRSSEVVAAEASLLAHGARELWSTSFSVTGSGVTNTDGQLFVPAGINGTALVNDLSIDEGEYVYVKLTVDPPDAVFREAYITYRDGGSTLVRRVPYWGNGIYGAAHKMVSPIATATEAVLSFDNRDPASGGLGIYTDEDVTVSISMIPGNKPPAPNTVEPDLAVYDMAEVVVIETSTTSISFYVRASASLNRYVEYVMDRLDDIAEGTAGTNKLVWHQGRIHWCRRDSATGFTRLYEIARPEHTIAVRENGKADNMGGVHGDHRDDGAGDFSRLLLDGQVTTITGGGLVHSVRNGEFISSSRLIEARTTESGAFNTNARARVTTRHTFDGADASMVIAHRIEILENFTVDDFYCAMFNPYPHLSNSSSNPRLMHRAYRWPEWEEEDVSGTVTLTNSTSRHFRISGDSSCGIGVECEMIEGWTPASRNSFINTAHKLYFELLSSVALTAGETYDTACRYRIYGDGPA